METVRYYQRRGLLPTPQIARGRFRRYGLDTLERLQGIKRAKRVGFTLAEIAILLRSDRRRDRQAAQRLAVRKVTDIGSQIGALQAIRRSLQALVDACSKGHKELPCPIIETAVGREGFNRPDRRIAQSGAASQRPKEGRHGRAQAS